ncbi:MAG: lipid-A-disaccharide synthase [Myxococcales bacterium]|nr:lipid-A-disaccharide synthase [Polyangiaceae bacterium]MDW8251447.1 lipid-A-disaccharide synthase [Myxococcales bacterium]
MRLLSYPSTSPAGSTDLGGLLVVAGETSGDALGAAVLQALGGTHVVWGLGGPALRRAGASPLLDFQAIHANGLGDVVRVLPRAAAAAVHLVRQTRLRRPRAALLIDATSFNARLGRWLRAEGVPVLWCVAPQIWAWRPERGPALARAMDRLATLFSFEVPLWRSLGVDARWVGHPVLDTSFPCREEARSSLGILPSTPTLALLPGSRPGEVARLLPLFLQAANLLKRSDGIRTWLLLAPSLPSALVVQAMRAARCQEVRVLQVAPGQGLAPWLPAFDAALCASGTASLECVLAAVPPVVAYRVDALTAWLARRWLRTEYVALPNLLLGRRVFPELLQERCTPEQLALEARRLLMVGPAREPRDQLRATLSPEDGLTVGARVAAMLAPPPGRSARP